MVRPIERNESSAFKPPEHKEVKDPWEFIMKIEDTLQTKFHHGEISKDQFLKFSKIVASMQKQYNKAKRRNMNLHKKSMNNYRLV